MNYRRLYEYRFRGIDQRAREEVWAQIASFMYDELGRPEKVLDPAAGYCEFINTIPSPERWAVDQTSFEATRASPGTKLVVADIMQMDLPDDHFDAVFVSNFLEHLPTQEDVARFLERIRVSIRPGGRIAVMGPNYRYCAGTYWDCADHYLALTHVAVEEHLYAAGFTLTKTVPRFLPYSFRGSLPHAPRLVHLYLRLPLAWRVLGRQFLVLAER